MPFMIWHPISSLVCDSVWWQILKCQCCWIVWGVRFHAPTRWTQKLKPLGRGGQSTLYFNTPTHVQPHTRRKRGNKGAEDLNDASAMTRTWDLWHDTMLGFMHQPDELKSLSHWEEVGNPLYTSTWGDLFLLWILPKFMFWCHKLFTVCLIYYPFLVIRL